MKAILSLFFFTLMLAACGGRIGQEPAQPPEFDFPVRASAEDFERDEAAFPVENRRPHEVLRTGDVVRVGLWGDDTITGDYPVGPDGFVSVPLIGDVEARGAVRTELTAALRDSLVRYYEEPVLDVSVASYAPRYAYVFGALRAPGAIELSPEDTLLTVIAKAGGLQIRKDERGKSLGIPRLARVIRDDQMALLDLRALVSGEDLRSNIAVAPGDMVYIPEEDTPTVSIIGEVRSPGLYGLTPGMDALNAISAAGGYTNDGRADAVRVVRRWWTEEPEVILVDVDAMEDGDGWGPVLLEDQDLVYVPTRHLSKFSWAARQISSGLFVTSVVPVSPTGP